MKKYKTFNHAKTRLKYHLIFSTKYRKKLLEPIRDKIFESMYFAENQNGDFKIEVMEIDKDHIHFLISTKPSISISDVVKTLKQHSTYYVWKNNYDYMRTFYWKQHHLWTRGYFITTIGECSDEKIKHYIENQG
jgi:putative transposase